MTEHHTEPGPTTDKEDPKDAELKVKAAREKEQKAQAEAEAEQAEQRAEKVEQEAKAAEEPAAPKKQAKAAEAKPAAPKKQAKAAEAKPAAAKKQAKGKPAEPEAEPELEVVEKTVAPKQKPELDETLSDALAARSEKKARTPRFRRHEWWRYKRLGGKHAPWRRPRGMHSKQRRHFKYRPPVVSIGYRGPRAARGLHPSGFEEVLVYRPEDLSQVDPKVQAARVGGTVGGRKAELIEKEADKLGIRVLNRRNS